MNSNSSASNRPAAKRRTVIVVAIDRTEASDAVLPMAQSYAENTPGAELHLLLVVEHPPPIGPTVPSIAEDLREARAYLDDVVHVAAERFSGRIAGHIAVGDPATRILELASDLEADVIIVGTHGKSTLTRMVLGSVSQRVSLRAQCPVLLARPKAYAPTPEIEPPCPKCLEMQHATNGEKLWCAQHATHHPRGRLHYEAPQSFAMGSMLIRPNEH